MSTPTIKSGEELSRLIQITDNQIVSGRLFRAGEQYLFDEVTQETRSCGCPGGNAQMITIYVVTIAGVKCRIDGRYAVQTRHLNGATVADALNTKQMAAPPPDENGNPRNYDDFGNVMPDGTIYPNNYNPQGEMDRFKSLARMNMRKA